MGRDQRVHDNHALLRAQEVALEQKLPVLVIFNVLPKTGDRAKEHYEFMKLGLKEVETELKDLNIEFNLMFESGAKGLLSELNKLNPSAVVFDFSPLNGPKSCKQYIAKNAEYKVEVVDAHNIIPTWVASDKEEFAAYTFRNKVHKQLENWLEDTQRRKFTFTKI